MGDTGVDILLNMIDNNVINGDVIVVVEGMEMEDEDVMVQTSETGTIIYKNFSCQTEFTTKNRANLPVIFCGLFSPTCDAITQCDIPLKEDVCLSTHQSREFDSEIRDATKDINKDPLAIHDESKLLVKEETDLLQQTIEEEILGMPTVGGNGNNVMLFNYDSVGKETAECADAVSTQCIQQSPKRQRRRKKTCKDDAFNWENDICFWNEAEKKPRKRKKKSKVEETFNGELFNSRNCSIKQENIHTLRDKNVPTEKPGQFPIHPELPRKANKESAHGVREVIDIKEEVQTEEWCSDWITDDEVDDDETGKPTYNEGNRTCSHCMLTFNSPLLLLEHTEANHSAHVCNICGFTTTFKHKLKRHLVKHSKEKAFVCDICGKQYSQNQNLRDHISRVHSDYNYGNRYPFSCQHCRRLYRDERNLIRHQKQESGPCEVCGIMLKCSGLLWHHKRDHFSQCEICKKGFQSRNTLLLHKSTKHGEKSIQCSLCPKKFVFQSHLKNHLANTHNEGSLQYKCPECGFCARSKSYLKSHQNRMHKHPLKVYSCVSCKKDFRSNARLVEHTRIHTGERPFSCPVCCKTFYSQSNLYAHERSVHNRLTNYGSRDTDTQRDTAMVRRKISSCYKCHLCDSTFPTRKKLKYHLFRDHRVNDSDDVNMEKIAKQAQIMEINEAGMAPVQIEVNNENNSSEDFEPIIKKEEVMNVIPSCDENVVSRPALSLPAYVVPPNVNLVEIDGIQYHVLRNNQ